MSMWMHRLRTEIIYRFFQRPNHRSVVIWITNRKFSLPFCVFCWWFFFIFCIFAFCFSYWFSQMADYLIQRCNNKPKTIFQNGFLSRPPLKSPNEFIYLSSLPHYYCIFYSLFYSSLHFLPHFFCSLMYVHVCVCWLNFMTNENKCQAREKEYLGREEKKKNEMYMLFGVCVWVRIFFAVQEEFGNLLWSCWQQLRGLNGIVGDELFDPATMQQFNQKFCVSFWFLTKPFISDGCILLSLFGFI